MSDHLFAPADCGGGAQPAGYSGVGLRVGSPYTREQQWSVGVLIAAAALIPLGLMLLSSHLLFILVAVIILLFESWLIRFVYVKIPHTSPLEVRSGQ